MESEILDEKIISGAIIKLFMYFRDRQEAGELLADELREYRYENCAVVALSDGAVLVAEQIARRLHTTLSLLMTKNIELPGYNVSVGSLDHTGGFVYNDMLPAGQLEELMSEMHGYVEEEKLRQIYDMTSMLGDAGLTDPSYLKGRSVIVVSDGMKSGLSFTAADAFLKPIDIDKVVSAVPVATVKAVDRLHLLSDEIHCLSVVDNYFDTDHYYEDNTKPDHESIMRTLNDIIKKWA